MSIRFGQGLSSDHVPPISQESICHYDELSHDRCKGDFPRFSCANELIVFCLERHGKTISGLNKFEDIRYPGANQHAMAVAAEWSGPAGEVTAYGGITTPKQYTLVVSEIDDLIADAFKMSNWNPSGFMGTNPAALEAI